MLKKIFFIVLFAVVPQATIYAQKKEMAQAKSDIKAGKSLAEAEASMRKLLGDSANRNNEKIWLVLFDAVRKQYETVNEQMYLKQSSDTAKLFDTTLRMFYVLEGLDSIDAAPDGKGLTKLKYRHKNAEYLNSYRKNLYAGGLYYMSKQDHGKAYDMFEAYVDCASQPLFEGYDLRRKDGRLQSAAFYAVYNAFKNGDGKGALRHADLALGDTVHRSLTLQYMAETYRTQGDTTNYMATLKQGFDGSPTSKYFFPHLFDACFKNGDVKSALEMCDRALAVDSADVMPLLAKSAVDLTLERYGECIAVSEKIIALDGSLADAYLNAGLAYFNQAVKIDKQTKLTREQRKRMVALYGKALPYMATYRKLEPTRKDMWALPLYTIYLNLNMGKEFEEMDAVVKQMR